MVDKGYIRFKFDIAFVEKMTMNLINRNSIIFYHMIQYIVLIHVATYKIWLGGACKLC